MHRVRVQIVGSTGSIFIYAAWGGRETGLDVIFWPAVRLSIPYFLSQRLGSIFFHSSVLVV